MSAKYQVRNGGKFPTLTLGLSNSSDANSEGRHDRACESSLSSG